MWDGLQWLCISIIDLSTSPSTSTGIHWWLDHYWHMDTLIVPLCKIVYCASPQLAIQQTCTQLHTNSNTVQLSQTQQCEKAKKQKNKKNSYCGPFDCLHSTTVSKGSWTGLALSNLTTYTDSLAVTHWNSCRPSFLVVVQPSGQVRWRRTLRQIFFPLIINRCLLLV